MSIRAPWVPRSAHGDVFPLPPPARAQHGHFLSPSLSTCSREELGQVRVAAYALNRLVAPRDGELHNARQPCGGIVTNLQRRVLSGMLSRIRLYGPPPEDLSPEKAFFRARGVEGAIQPRAAESCRF